MDIRCPYLHCVLGMFPRCPICGAHCSCPSCVSAYRDHDDTAIYFTTEPRTTRVIDEGNGLYRIELSSDETSTLGPVQIPLTFDD